MANLAILVLTVYMSKKFSEPLTSLGQNFLLVYQSDLKRLTNIVNVRMPEFERDARAKRRAIKFQEEAVKDADR